MKAPFFILRRATPILVLILLATACSDGPAEGSEEHEEHEEHQEDTHEPGVIELGPEMRERITIREAAVSLRRLPTELLTTGQVDFEQDLIAHVTPRIPGRVEEVQADLGDTVRKGQILAVIDSIELGQAKADYLQARAQEELSRQNFERETGLYAEHISSEKEMLVAKAAHLASIAELRHSEETLRLYGLEARQIQALSYEIGQVSLLPVRSPLAGRVVEKHVAVGEMVTPERSLFTIADMGHVWIWIDVYEKDVGNVHLEDDVSLAVDAYPGELFGGKVSYLSAQVDPGTRTVRARIDVENPQHKLRPGMFARVTVRDPHTESTDPHPSLVVPAGAVQRDGHEFVVFVSLGDGRFERREVEVGRAAEGVVEILSGLDEDDTVVIEGAFLLKSEASKGSMGAGHDH